MYKRKTTWGRSAISKFARQSKDYLVTQAKYRYGGKGGFLNVASDVTKLAALLNAEAKEIVTAVTATSVTAAASSITGIGTVAQGTTSGTRTGDSIKINRIDGIIRFDFSSGTAATSSIQEQTFNWYLVKYNKTPSTSGTTPFAISEFLNLDANSLYTPLSFPNADTNQNFSILQSGQSIVNLSYVSTATSAKSAMVEFSIPCNFHQVYSGAAANTITDNMVFLVVTALQPANAGGVTTYQYSTRTWFIDN